MSNIRLHKGDCIEGMQSLGDAAVDVVVTSPPYNIGKEYGSYDDGIPRDDYLDWCRGWIVEIWHVLREGGSFFLNIGGKPSDPWVPFDVVQIVRRYFQLQNTFIWVKSIAIDEMTHGHYKPINSPRFVNDCFEYVFHFSHEGKVPLDRLAVGVPYADKSNIERWQGKQDRRCRGNTWFLPYDTIQRRSDRPHPATFPVALPEMCLKLHGVERIQQVLDPFMGIGTTALACYNLDLDCIGFEIDDDYWQYSRERIPAGRTEGGQG